MTRFAGLKDVRIHYRDEGVPDGAPVVFAHALGTDLTLWDNIVPLLPVGLRVVRYDARGHGQSSCPDGPYSMGALVRDAEQLLDHLGLRDCVFVGLSMGGMVAQGLAVKRLDQVRAMVLSNTAAKIGTAAMWHDRARVAREQGIEALADATLARWFPRPFRDSPQAAHWRAVMTGQLVEGYASCCAAIAGTDFYTPTSGLGLPTLGIAGSHDGTTPPDLVRETVDLVRGSKFHLIRGAGHLPCVDKPGDYAEALTGFLRDIGHI
ncbi:3-oxoadipate enol-lactonase [Actibacterium sp. XHP0104]|uniref:3-oxoadipate enol-lactonase n=1 Tax=Actibacterium sp. XHP0104 TaxID=2984335 RepID=UPI0021E8439F|nr:3-oxoadipate enol-lactonase [Actibacterium sp. XHP0104]MCV2882209.1 3-oxoadipate enol-lactonase [Actibacterium sp. XHP0104]